MPRLATGFIFVPGNGVLYVAPRLITHYIRGHGYQPPAAFLEALRTMPEDPVALRHAAAAHLIGRVEEPRDPNVYDARDIEVLEGLEPVRVRPAMYLGSRDSRALSRMIDVVVGVGIEQFLAGATRLSLDINEAGVVSVEDDGNGISTDVRVNGRSRLELTFGVLMPGDEHVRFPDARAAVTYAPYGLNPAVVTALSSRFEVETRRGGVAFRLAYAAGIRLRPLEQAGATSRRGTSIRYQPDDEIFDEDTRHDLPAIEKRLIDLARLCPELDLRFQGRSLQRPEGLSSWIHDVAPEAVKETLLRGSGTVKDVDVDFALAWRPRSNDPLVRSFVDYEETRAGGSHERGLLSAVEQVISAKRASRKKKVLSGLVAIVHVGKKYPDFRWEGTQYEYEQKSLTNEDVRVAVRDVVTKAINAAPWWWDRLHTAIG